MPVEFFDYKGEIAYREVPTIVDKEYANAVQGLMHKHESRCNNGWSKDKSLRFAGQIPREVYFNKIQETKNQLYWSENNGINMKRWFNENPSFRIGDKYLKGSH